LGTLDATIIAQNNAGPFYPKLDILTLPYIFQSPEHAKAIVDGPIGQEIWKDMPSEAGVHLVKITAIAFRHLYNTERAIENIEDFKSLKYRVPKNSVMVDTYKAFGADPVPLAWSETLTAVQTGTVDGGDLTIDVIYSQKFHEVAKYIAMTGHFVFTPPFFVSDRFMSKLTDDEKKAVYAAANIAAEVTRKMVAEEESTLIDALKSEHGVAFTVPEKAPFIEAAAAVQAQFAKARGAGYEALVTAIKQQADAAKKDEAVVTIASPVLKQDNANQTQ
jgi:tripartite ATP-independent transporter DctP family solute receptor